MSSKLTDINILSVYITYIFLSRIKIPLTKNQKIITLNTMPKKKVSKKPRVTRIKLTTDLKVLQLIIVIVLFAFAFMVISFVTQVASLSPKEVVSIPDQVLTETNLLLNTSSWKTYNSNGIRFKYPGNWVIEEKSTNLGPKMGEHTFFSRGIGAKNGIALFVLPKILPGEWISNVYSPNFLEQAESLSLLTIDSLQATKVVNLPIEMKNEIVFVTKNNTTYILFSRGTEENNRILENLLRTVKFN
jgi:hypothetical protein